MISLLLSNSANKGVITNEWKKKTLPKLKIHNSSKNMSCASEMQILQIMDLDPDLDRIIQVRQTIDNSLSCYQDSISRNSLISFPAF